MPTIEILESLLVEKLGLKPLQHKKDFEDFKKDFSKLCFDFGIELDEVTSEFEKISREKGADVAKKMNASTARLYKIELPANRYDLLSVEGLTCALRIFQKKEKIPDYKTERPKDDALLTMKVTKMTKDIRPYVVCAVLRDIEFTEASLQSFIDLQEKLHFNICRRRSLCAIGTHDLDTLTPPFIYDCRPPSEIKFVALKEEKEMTAKELFDEYKNRSVCSVREYLPIIEHFPAYPIIYDSKGVVLSLPPIINGEHSKITLKTKNVFIESTCTDLTKANIALNVLVTAFGEYCKKPFVVEQVQVVFDPEHGHSNYFTPNYANHVFTTSSQYINDMLGTKLSSTDVITLLQQMSLHVQLKDESSGTLEVWAPPTRGDILHPVDVVEDVAIAYGYNNLERKLPEHHTTGAEQPLNMLSDKIRECVALCGFCEVLNWALISKQESYDFMRIPDLKKAVEIEHPKTHEFQICRINLLPGVLKTLQANIGKCALPLHLFEVGDVVLIDEEKAVKARNERRLCALTCSAKQSGFEFIHGLLNRIMQQNHFEFVSQAELKEKHNNRWPTEGKNIYGTPQMYYSIAPSDRPTFFPQRQAMILVDGLIIGYFGVLHPLVLKNFGIYHVSNVMVSAIELNLHPFL